MADIESQDRPVKEPEETTSTVEPEVFTSGDVVDEASEEISKAKSIRWTKPPLKTYGQQALEYLGKLDYLGDFFAKYQGPITTLVLIVAAFVSVKVTLAAINAINDIPLLSPLFELIGLGYSGWFIWRYLARASTRKELVEDIKALGEQVTGGREPKD